MFPLIDFDEKWFEEIEPFWHEKGKAAAASLALRHINLAQVEEFTSSHN